MLPRDPAVVRDELELVRARGWALADEELAPGIRSVAVPVRDGTGQVRAAMNVTVHAAETTVETLVEDYLPTTDPRRGGRQRGLDPPGRLPARPGPAAGRPGVSRRTA